MAFTVVGSSFLGEDSPSDPQSHSLALPSGSAVGDLIVFCAEGGSGLVLDDSRLTPVDMGYPGWLVGGVGVATDLSDIGWETEFYTPGVGLCVVLRGAPAVFEASGKVEGDHSLMDLPESAGYSQALVIYLDVESSPPGLIPDDSWATAGSGSWDNGSIYFEALAQSWTAGDPVGSLAVYEDAYGGSRTRMVVMWPTGRNTLRRRQIPRAGRVRQAPDGLRQRQRFV